MQRRAQLFGCRSSSHLPRRKFTTMATASTSALAQTSKKRKRAANAEEEDLYDAVLHESDAEGAGSPSEDEEESAEDAPTGKVIDIAALSKLNSKIDKTGVVYVSRIPPGMGPAKLKHILSRFGETDRVYLARDPKDTRKQLKRKKNGKEKHQAHRFVEGWVEFVDKKKAKATAELLNAKPIGGKASSPFYSDIWTMKYLPRFKWNMLSALNAQQRASDQALLRNEISQSKKAQSDYLSQVDKARVLRIRAEKKASNGEQSTSTAKGTGDNETQAATSKKNDKQYRTFKQRSTIKNSQKETPSSSRGSDAKQKALDNVLGSLFG